MNQRLLNRYEEITYGALKGPCERNGARVFPKVRLADVFEINQSGIPKEQFSYALRSHFDFLVADADFQPLFSVEFDGPLHKSSAEQRRRDTLKNTLCERFSHGLLRVNANYLSKKYRGLDLLTYFVEAWFLADAFGQAQKKGLVPYDEDFDMAFILRDETRPGTKWPYWISLDVQLAFQKLHKQKVIGQMVPSYWIGVDNEGTYRCLSWVVFDAKSVLSITIGMRAQRFWAVNLCDLVEMLSFFELYEKLQETLKTGRGPLQDRTYFQEVTLLQFKSKYKAAGSGSCSATV
ncbi:DUF2726 domain-containing protein [Rheinheimera texasensis]|uniref:DUF2726 domain-containing protein n=1 Tax=Rheinheimera texasensis TaxID=306205 RepID=UPI0032B1ECCF